MADLKIQGEVSLDATDAEQAISRVDAGARKMAQSVARSGKTAADGMAAVGTSSRGAADNITREEGRMRASIKRATFDLETLGKTMSQKFEAKITMQGLDPAAFRTQIEALKQLETQQKRAMGTMQVSAAQTAAAMRGVPAQFTDIITSLQGGQAPLTVFLQQGGQLKDMFGGAGNAARALGGYVMGLVNPFTLAAGAVATLGLAYYKGSQEADAYRKALVMTGNAAGTTAGEMQSMAARVSSSGGTQGNAASVLAQLAGTGEVSRANLVKFGEATVAAERNIGTAVADTVKHFAELGKSPVDASLKLNEQYRYLTASVYEQIRALRDQGRQVEAANLAQTTYASAMASRADELKGSLGSIERAWRGIAGAAKGGWDAMLNVGRAETAADQLSTVGEKIARLRKTQENGGYDSNGGGAAFGRGTAGAGARERELQGLLGQQAALQEMVRLEQRGAEAQARKVAANEAGIRFSNIEYEARSKQKKLEEEIAKVRADGVLAGKTEAEIQKAIATVKAQDKYKDSGAESAIKREQSAYASLIASIKTKIAQNDEDLRTSGRLTEADKLRIKLMAELDAGAKTLTAGHKAEALALIGKLDVQERAKRVMQQTVALYEEQAAQAEEVAQAQAAESKAREQGILAVYAYGKGIQDANDAAAYELSLLGKSEAARERAMAQYRVELDLRKQLEAIDKNTSFGPADRERESAKAKSAAGNALAGVDSRLALDKLKELDAYLDPARAKDFGAALRDAFGEAGNALAQLTNAFQGYAQQQAEIAKMQETLRSSEGQIDQGEYYKREQALAKKSAQAQIGSYASIAGAAKGFFKDHSKGYNAMAAVEKGFRLMEMGMAIESMTKQLFGITAVKTATQTAEAEKVAATVAGVGTEVAAQEAKGLAAAKTGIANAAGGDPYTALARMAAMAAAMAALGFVVSGSGGDSSSAVREARQKAQGTGTVFGDSDAKSGSLGNAFDMLEDSAKIELRYQSGMLASLRNIENSMAGVANAVLRTAGITSGNAPGVIEGVISINTGINPLLDATANLPIIGGITKTLQSLWGKTKQEITDSGLTINGAVSALMGGEGFGSYTDITKTKSSFFGLSKSSKSRTEFGELDDGTNDALARVFRNLSSTLVLAAGAFGRDAEQVGQQIAATVIDIPRVSLRDLKGEDLQEAITSTISAAADTIGKTVTPGLEDFQKVGEGYFETIIRVSSGIESADYALERFGIGAIGFQEVLGKQGDVAAEIFRDSVARFEGAGKGITQILQGVSGSVDDLADTYRDLITVRNSLKSVGANGSDPSFDLLRGAGGIEALQDGLDAYLEGFFSETERYTSASARLSEQFAQIGIAQPQDIASFRALANSLDLTDAASAQLFGRLMNVAEAFYDVAGAVTASERNLKEAFDDVAADWLGADDLRAYRATRISEGLGDVGLSISPEQLLGASAEQFKDMYYAIDRTTMAGREQATSLLEVWDAFQEMNKAAEEAKTAWRGLADSIVDEIKRIRGEMAGNEQQGIAQAQAEFAIATAKARAGDEAAAGDLPTLSRAVLDLAKKTASSATDLKVFQGQIAASLAATTQEIAAKQGIAVPAFASGGVHAGGWAVVGEKGPELVNLPPSRIFSASQSASMMGNTERLEQLVEQLVDDNRRISGDLARLQMRIAKASESTARVLDDVTEGGVAMRTAEVAP